MRKEFHLKYINSSLSGFWNIKCELIYFRLNFPVSIFYSRSHNVKCNLCNFRQALCIIMNTKRRIKGPNVIVEKTILANLSVPPPQFTADNYTYFIIIWGEMLGCPGPWHSADTSTLLLALCFNVFCKVIIWQSHYTTTTQTHYLVKTGLKNFQFTQKKNWKTQYIQEIFFKIS